ncbi:MAG TPA: ABC transporter permease [Acidimicrobiales bacterium]
MLTAPVPADNQRPPAAASKRMLVWRRFTRHRLAVAGLAITALLAFVSLFGEFFAPYSAEYYRADYAYAPPQRVRLLDGGWNPHAYGYTSTADPETFEVVWDVDTSVKIPLGFFVRGESYELLGLVESDIHFFGPRDPDAAAPVYLLGADRNGHDLLSRIIVGTRVSMSIGLVAVALAFLLGVVVGSVSGAIGGWVDSLLQRIGEGVLSLPTLPLWLGLSAALPPTWDPLKRYVAISAILAMTAWTTLARAVRSRFLSLREEDFVRAAYVDGARLPRIVFRHMLPSFSSHLIAALTLSVPATVLAETSLSFLGLGLQPPVVSLGVLLHDAENIRVVTSAPWLLLPGVVLVAAVLALNVVGDGLRDAVDPYQAGRP